MGETDRVLYATLLLGAFPLWAFDEVPRNRFLALEWMVPAELDRCPAFSSSGQCDVYEFRPISCRNFPVIGPDGKLHDFCPMAQRFSSCPFFEPGFAETERKIIDFLKERFESRGPEAMASYVFEEEPRAMPMLYNGLWCLFLTAAGADVPDAIQGQKDLLGRIASGGLSEVTVLIPHSDYCISCRIEGLMVNLDYLAARCEQASLVERCRSILFEILGRETLS